MSTTTLMCEVCGEELTYSGRGRPPKRCEAHKKSAQNKNGKGEKVSETRTRPRPRPSRESESQPRPRPRPGQKTAEQIAGDEAHSPGSDSAAKPEHTLPGVGKSDRGSRAKAETAARRASTQTDELVAWPANPQGKPLARIDFSASELVPTGQYANVSIGPARVTVFVDLNRELKDDEGYFEASERDVLVKSINELAEVVERDIIAIQRQLVMESMQEQLASS